MIQSLRCLIRSLLLLYDIVTVQEFAYLVLLPILVTRFFESFFFFRFFVFLINPVLFSFPLVSFPHCLFFDLDLLFFSHSLISISLTLMYFYLRILIWYPLELICLKTPQDRLSSLPHNDMTQDEKSVVSSLFFFFDCPLCFMV